MLSRLMTVREQWILLGVAGAIVFGGAVLIWRAHQPAGGTETVLLPPPAEASPAPAGTPPLPPSATAPASALPVPEAPPARIGVGVLGAVQQPGLYYFETGARVQDLLAAAGGALDDGDLSDINRTALLIDATTLLVPQVVVEGRSTYRLPAEPHNPPEYTRSSWYPYAQQANAEAADAPLPHARHDGVAPAPAPHAARVNINTATQAQLESLPGIGPVTARKIIDHRRRQPFHRPEDLENVSGIGPARLAAVRDLITVR